MADLTRASINTMSRPPMGGGGGFGGGQPSGFGGGAAGAAGMTPKEIIAIFRRHIFMIICFTVLGVIVGGAGWFLCLTYIPQYTALGLVEVASPERKDPTKIETSMSNKDILYQNRVSMAALMTQDSLFSDLLQRDTIKRTEWYQKLPNKQVDGIKELKKNFRASPQRESQYITVSMKTPSAGEATTIVSEMIDLFLKTQTNINQDEIRGKLANLKSQEDILKRDLRSANTALDELRANSGFTGLDNQDEFEHSLNQKEQQIVLDLDRIESEITDADEQIKTYQQRLESVGIDPVTQSQTEQDPIVLNLKQQEASLKALLEEKQANLGENHRVIKEIRERINQTVQQRIERYNEIAKVNRESLLTSATDQKRQLEAVQQSLFEKQKDSTEQLKRLDQARAQYQILKTTRDQYKDRLEQMTTQIEKFQTLIDDPETPRVRSAGRVRPPLEPSFPKWQIFFPGGFVLGFMLGAGLAFLVEFLNTKLRTPKDIAQNIRLPLLGMICHSNEDKDVKKISSTARALIEAPYSITSEFYRQIRTNLKKSVSGTDNKVILITSTSGGEGRTSIASNLSAAFIAEGKSVVFVDANFRRPASLSVFPKSGSDVPAGTQQVSGLSNYLMGKCQISDIIRHCSKTNIDIIDCGPLPLNPSELLESQRMTELLQQLSARFDYVVIDGPPMLVADAKVLALKADGTIIVFNALKTNRGAAQRTVRELKEINANILGCTLVAVRSLKGGYFEEMFRSYRDYQKTQLAGAV